MPSKLLVALAVLVGAGWCFAACSSMKKSEIASALAQLPKNAPLAAHGLETRVIDATIAGEQRAFEATYFHAGLAGAPRLVFVHGTPGTLYTWSRVLFGDGEEAGLVADHEVWALEMLGHGIAEEHLESTTFQGEAEWLAAFLDALDLTDVVLVANSYGGEFAWRAALDRPERVRGLVLMSSSGYARTDDQWLPEEKAMRKVPGAKLGYLLNSKKRIRSALEIHYHGPIDDVLDEMYFVADNKHNWAAMVELARDENGTRADELPSLEAPTLLLQGSDDRAYSVESFARRFERDLPNARLEVIEGAGHYPQEEFPDEVVRAIRAFVAELDPTAKK